MSNDTRYPEWKAPSEDSALLIWPEPADILAQTRGNFFRISQSRIIIAGQSLADLRAGIRATIPLSNEQMVIATGHQAELYHAGVWAKLALIHAAAKKLGATAIHLAVDTDSPKHLHLRWPGRAWPITDDPNLLSAHWTGQLRGPSAGYVKKMREDLRNAAKDWKFTPVVDAFLASLSEGTLPKNIVDSQHQLDESLGLTHRAVMASPLFESEGYLSLVLHVVRDAEKFARVYNEALHEYRVKHKLRTSARPMPDLRVEPDKCESPFWVDDLVSGDRARAMLARRNGRWEIQIGQDRFETTGSAAELQKFLKDHRHRLSPRALTLTLFMRLLVVDQFVHGIGGGRYDQVTNRVIENFFGIEPPAFSVSTATLYFPEAVGRARVCLPCLAREGHRLRHGILGDAKRQWVDQIERLPRRSIERQQAFSQMHGTISQALLRDARVAQWQKRVEESNELHLEEQALFDRELFYAMQTKERLIGLIDAYKLRFL